MFLARLSVVARPLGLLPLETLHLLRGHQEELPAGGALHGRPQVWNTSVTSIIRKIISNIMGNIIGYILSRHYSSYAGYVPNNALKCQRSRDRLLEQYQSNQNG